MKTFFSLLVCILVSYQSIAQNHELSNFMDSNGLTCNNFPESIKSISQIQKISNLGKSNQHSSTHKVHCKCYKIKIEKKKYTYSDKPKFYNYLNKSIDVYRFREGVVDVYEMDNQTRKYPLDQKHINKLIFVDSYRFERKEEDYNVLIRVGYKDYDDVQTLIHSRNFDKNLSDPAKAQKQNAEAYDLDDIDLVEGVSFEYFDTGTWKSIYSTAYSQNRTAFIYDPLFGSKYKLDQYAGKNYQ